MLFKNEIGNSNEEKWVEFLLNHCSKVTAQIALIKFSPLEPIFPLEKAKIKSILFFEQKNLQFSFLLDILREL
jgi:hypothetical protein